MPSRTAAHTPSLAVYLKSLKQCEIESAIDFLISLLQRRQITGSRSCALATAHLLLRVVAAERVRDARALIRRIRRVGRRLIAAQPREIAVGNIVRRVLGVVREVAEEDQNTAPVQGSGGDDRSSVGRRDDAPDKAPDLASSSSSLAMPAEVTSLFGIFQSPAGASSDAAASMHSVPPASKPSHRRAGEPQEKRGKLDLKAEVIDGIKELLDELDVVDAQIAESALDHIHSNEIILTHTSSQTVQRFLAAAARKRKFTLVHAEAYPNDHLSTHDTVVNGGKKDTTGADDDDNERWKPLTQMGITVIVIPDSAVFALMSRINKVILAPHTVLANGSLIAAAGSATIAQAAKEHHVPVVVLSGVYKLSPVYPYDTSELIEYGDPGKVVDYSDGEFVEGVDVVNPVYDHVDAENVNLYITNLGAHAPSYLYRIVADHYRVEDVDLAADG